MRVPQLGFVDHIFEHSGAAAEVVGVDAEEESPAYEDDITRCQVKLRVPRYGIAFAWRWGVGVDERCVPGPFC